ncbi:MAG: aminotransferase class V-fold PLP-dependent enzyme [Anaerolineales bacterium]|nr:aminotransferase class V-fold PLP-dependent enzyme [Anaerolineales bacterium]
MNHESPIPLEETLDPMDWEAMRALGHRMVDDVIDYLKTVRERPAWRHAPDEVKSHFTAPLPRDPTPPEEVYNEFLEYVLPYPVGNIHPRFWGWVFGTGTVFGAFAELLAATMNVGASGALAYHSASYVEKQVIDWFKEMLGFPTSTAGLLTSGCSASNMIGLGLACNMMAGYDFRREGVSAAQKKMIFYASQEIHSSVPKALELLGIGSSSLRLLPVNNQYQIDINALNAAIERDRQDGDQPICVIGAAGTTNTGAVDDLVALAEIAERKRLWFHVDGAFGAWAALAPKSRHLVAGIERADSLAFDLHKWMYMPYDIGCILVKSEEYLAKSFSVTPAYLEHGVGDRGLTGSDLPWFGTYGLQLSRGFRALKAWMSLKQHGANKYSRLIQQNIDQAHYLAQLVDSAAELELAAPVILNVVCFRFTAPDVEDRALNELNKQIEIELQERGVAVISGTSLGGNYVLHLAHCNHRTSLRDFDELIRHVIRIGKDLAEPASA